MNTTELIDAVRLAGGIPSADVDFTDERILTILHQAEMEAFGRILTNVREGVWLKQYKITTTAGLPYYRLPSRAVAQAAERVEILNSGRWQPLSKLTTLEASSWLGTEVGTPTAYTLRGDTLQLLAAPASATTLRVHYYLRPSILVLPQEGVGEGEEEAAGLITAITGSGTTWTLTLNGAPDNMITEDPVATGDLVDIVRGDTGDVVGVDLVRTAGGVTGDASLAMVGDFIRAAGQAEWPQLPVDLHSALADAAAAYIQMDKGMDPSGLGSKVQNALQKYVDILTPRVKDSPQVIVGRYGVARRAARYG